MDISIPYNFEPRDYQVHLFKSMDSGIRRAYLLHHRRAGKDILSWNYMIKEACKTIGIYYYLLPTYAQAKKIIFDGKTNQGRAFLDYIPKQLIAKTNDSELKITLWNGSIIQLIGTDKYDSIRGTNPIGCVFSEFAFHNPLAWEVVRPILALNHGWAIFNTTPNGKNHSHKLWNAIQNNPKWYSQKLTVEDTNIITAEDLEEERMTMDRELFQQEYYCSFDVGMLGSVYGEQMELMHSQSRIIDIPIDNNYLVDVAFDIGSRDATAAIFAQRKMGWHDLIGHHEQVRKQPNYFFGIVDNFLEKNLCQLGHIYLPHDSRQQRFGQEKTVEEQFVDRYGDHKVKVVPITKSDRLAGINTVRRLFPQMRIHKSNCEHLIDCIENYHYKYDERRKEFSKDPDHDWTSHSCDALRYYCVEFEDHFKTIPLEQQEEKKEIIMKVKDYSVYDRFL